ncbi:MAG: AIM24 family protein, partial [Nitrososphaerota archaeon]
MSKCQRCGKEFRQGQVFCSNCGAPISGAATSVKYEIKYRPSYSMLVVKLEAGESIVGEAGALTYMSPNIEVRTKMRERGILGSLG